LVIVDNITSIGLGGHYWLAIINTLTLVGERGYQTGAIVGHNRFTLSLLPPH